MLYGVKNVRGNYVMLTNCEEKANAIAASGRNN